MAKSRTVYYCQQCGYESAKWVGQCASCHSWNTFAEEVVTKEALTPPPWKGKDKRSKAEKPRVLQEIKAGNEVRLLTDDQELNRVLGGGIVPGSLVLIGGEPGIGKSTLMLQVVMQLSKLKILYVSGEESDQQIRMRAERLQEKVTADHLYILTETETQRLFQQVEELQPQLVIIDSIQTLHSAQLESTAGSVGQVRQCAGELMRFAKETNTTVFLVGHITKDGMLAGPKVLEHMVDTVLQFEGDRHLAYRILRTTKNRFGSTAEIGIYEMQNTGLRQVTNPSEILISQKDSAISGVTIGATLEGNRPLLVEVQSLVSPASYGTPQRSSTGFDQKRLNMLLAVLEKRCGYRMGTQDVFLNIAGGITVEDPAIDLAVSVAMISSLEDIPLSDKICFAAEVGLGGELRAVNRMEQRITEAAKLGFEEIYISKFSKQAAMAVKENIKIKTFGKIQEVIGHLIQ